MQNLSTTMESLQLWAEHSSIRFPGLASETYVSGCYYSGYQSVIEYGWRECILIPFELFYKHVRKFTFKPFVKIDPVLAVKPILKNYSKKITLRI